VVAGPLWRALDSNKWPDTWASRAHRSPRAARGRGSPSHSSTATSKQNRLAEAQTQKPRSNAATPF
jgi:hypothetical protein